jgi:hypothetical protein
MNDDSAVSRLLRGYAEKFSGRNTPDAAGLDLPRVYLLDPSRAQEAKGTYLIRAQAVGLSQNIKSAKLFINGVLAPAPNTLQYNRETDAWRIKLNTATYEDGTSLAIKTIFTFEDGTILETEENPIIVANRVTYSVIKTYDFAADTANAVSLGGYQAEIKAIRHSSLNGGMLEIDCNFPGTNEWEELKIKFPSLNEVSRAAKISFTIYLRKDIAFPSPDKKNEASCLPGTQHYLAFDPGWVKTGIGEHTTFLKDIETVMLDDGNEYYAQTIAIEFFGNPSYTLVTICPTMGLVKYSGSLYLDDIVVYAKD